MLSGGHAPFISDRERLLRLMDAKPHAAHVAAAHAHASEAARSLRVLAI